MVVLSSLSDAPFVVNHHTHAESIMMQIDSRSHDRDTSEKPVFYRVFRM